MRTWIISDTHFFHDNLCEYCARPADFTEQIIRNWSNMVASNDLIYHLGDVGFYKKSEYANLVSGLPGFKILVRGNHDKFPVGWYLDHGFMAVVDHVLVNVRLQRGMTRIRNEYWKVLLSHIPMEIPKKNRYLDVPDGIIDPKVEAKRVVYKGNVYNVHGHFHNNSSDTWESEVKGLITPQHLLLSLEEWDYKPMELNVALSQSLFVHTLSRMQES